MARDPLTQRQNEAFEFIRQFIAEEEIPPSMREIGDALGISSSNGVYKLLRALEKKGWIEREKHSARSIQIVGEQRGLFSGDGTLPRLPVISRTSSHQPDKLHDRPRGTLAVDYGLLRNADDPDSCLIGRSGDDGMNGTGIHRNDLLLVEEMDWTNIENGETVAALLEERLLAREFEFVNKRIHLRPTDRHYTEETFQPNDPGCYIIGLVFGIIRSF